MQLQLVVLCMWEVSLDIHNKEVLQLQQVRQQLSELVGQEVQAEMQEMGEMDQSQELELELVGQVVQQQ
jgi:hypothetical protein